MTEINDDIKPPGMCLSTRLWPPAQSALLEVFLLGLPSPSQVFIFVFVFIFISSSYFVFISPILSWSYFIFWFIPPVFSSSNSISFPQQAQVHCFRHLPSSAGGWVAFSSFINLSICIVQSGIDEEPIGVVPDIGNVDFTDGKKQKQKGGKRRNKPRFKLVRSKLLIFDFCVITIGCSTKGWY